MSKNLGGSKAPLGATRHAMNGMACQASFQDASPQAPSGRFSGRTRRRLNVAEQLPWFDALVYGGSKPPLGATRRAMNGTDVFASFKTRRASAEPRVYSRYPGDGIGC
jgi:hypothetical protein